MPIFKIQHITRYEYDRPVRESVNEIKIYPYLSEGQEVLQHELLITGQPDIQHFVDYWGNRAGIFTLVPPHRELIINSRLMVRTTNSSELKMNFISRLEDLTPEISGQLKMLEFSLADPIGSQILIDEIAMTVYSPDHAVAATVKNCSDYIYEHFSYIKGITTIETTVDEILERRGGVCQDFAHLMLQILRSMKIPCRYVSGYICPNRRGLRGEGATHAWVEAWIPQFGWAGIDPTNNVWVTNTHVKLAVGRNFRDCSPVKGTFKGPSNQQLSVFVSIDYEDGQIFEELNKVHTPKHSLDLPVFSEAGAQQ